MILSSRRAKFAAVVLACSAHAGLGLALARQEPVEMEGSAGAAEVRIGTAFADMAAGVVAPVQVTERTAQSVPEATPAPKAPAETARKADPVTSPTAERTVARAAQAADSIPLQPATPAEPIAAQQPEATTLAALAPTPAATVTEPVAPAPPAAPVTAEPAATAAEPERIEATEPESAAAVTSRRPEARSTEFEKRNAPAPRMAERTDRKQKAKEPASRGNAQANARAGTSAGSETAVARSSGQAGKSEAQGNAARSNYPGLVMSRLSRIPRPSVNSQGTATVAFSISGNGGLAQVSLARGSGSAQLDQAALRLVRRAAPFPAPPSGAQRSFSVQITGR
ncbi:TonB family protein [Sulfitobacter sp. LCG007]